MFSSSATRAHLLLRLAVAFAFLYPPIAALTDPDSWLGYFPPYFFSLGVPEAILLHAFGVVEVILALWILSGKNIRVPAALATLALLLIVVLNANQFGVLFRDLSIAAASLALFFWPTAESSPVE
jgi:uncharacterized membrane protein YphA (DoxX/SURF4 family)